MTFSVTKENGKTSDCRRVCTYLHVISRVYSLTHCQFGKKYYEFRLEMLHKPAKIRACLYVILSVHLFSETHTVLQISFPYTKKALISDKECVTDTLDCVS